MKILEASLDKQKQHSYLTKWKKFWSEPGFAILSLILIACILLFIVFPVFAVLLRSFGLGSGELTLAHYTKFLSSTHFLKALLNSLTSAIVITVIITSLSLVVALYVTRTHGAFSKAYRGISLLPLVAPPFIFSLALIALLGRNGIVTNVIKDWTGLEFSIYGYWGVVVAQILAYFPVGYMLVESTFRNMSPSVERASSDLGANQFTTFMKVTFPLASSGIIKAALLVFVMSLADFSNPLVIGGNTSFLASEAYLQVIGQQNMEMAAVLGVFLIIPSFIVFIFQTYYLKDTNLETISGESGEAAIPLSKPIKAVVGTITTLFSLFIVLMFIMVILGAFVKILGVNNTFTLEHFTDQTGWDTLYLSVIVSLLAAILASVIGMLQGYIFARKPMPGKKAFEFLTLFGLAVPGTVMGIGYVLVFNGPPFFLTGTVLLLVLNMTFRKIGVGLEASISKMHQIDQSMEEASQDLGGGPYRTFVKIVAPLLSPSFIAGFVYTFMTAMVSISSVIFLIAPGTNLASIYILNLAEHAKIGMASAISFVLILIVIGCMGILKFIEKRTGIKTL